MAAGHGVLPYGQASRAPGLLPAPSMAKQAFPGHHGLLQPAPGGDAGWAPLLHPRGTGPPAPSLSPCHPWGSRAQGIQEGHVLGQRRLFLPPLGKFLWSQEVSSHGTGATSAALRTGFLGPEGQSKGRKSEERSIQEAVA